MKHLLNGVAIAAMLTMAAPVWAQAPASNPASNPGTPPAPMVKESAPRPMARQMHHARPMRHMAAMHRHAMARGGAGDAMTDQLNRQELARITSGGGGQPAPMGAPPPAGR